MWLSSIHKGSRNPMYPFESHCYEFALFSEPILGLFGAQLWNSLCWQSVEYCNNHFRCHPEDVYHRMKTSKLWWISKDPHPPSQPHFPLTSNFLTWGNIWSPDSFSEDITITSTAKKCFRSKKKSKLSLPVMIRRRGVIGLKTTSSELTLFSWCLTWRAVLLGHSACGCDKNTF